MKTAVFTDEISHDLERACRVCEEFGVKGAELRGVWNTNCSRFTDAQVREIGRIVDDHSMVVCSVGSPFGKCNLDSAREVAEHMDMLRRCCDIALELNCPMVRGFAFWDRHQAPEKPWDRMLTAYEPVPAILQEKGVLLGLENEASCYVGTAAHLRIFLDRLQCDRVKAVWDPANHVQDPQGRDLPCYPDGYELVKQDIIHVHVKDAAPDPAGGMPNVFLGTGVCRWPEQLQALKDDGYNGYLSIETHVNPEKFPHELQRLYGRYLTGEGREGASRVCLAWLRDALAALA